MKVAIVSESFLPNVNGVVNSVLRVLEHLERTGHEAVVIAPDTPRGEQSAPREVDGVPVHLVPSVNFPRVSSLPVGVPTWSLYRALSEHEPDVVHLASPFVIGGAGAYAARRLQVPSVAVFQTDVAGFASSYGMGLTTRAAWRWTKRLHSVCDRTLAPSSVSVTDLQRHGVPRVFRWGRGVDTERFNPERRSADLRARWGADGRLIVGFVGRLAPEKHVERIAALSGRRDVQIVVVGDGPERARLARLMPDAIFTGALSGVELAEAYASMDVFVHAGEHETFCQAVQEALASGVPVIGPDAGGPRDLIAHFRTGFLLPVPEFENRLPAAVDTLADDVVRAGFGAAARRSVQGRTWAGVCDELLGHYDAVLGREGSLRRPA
ncbi:glycosyltransferase family 4 protein [Williamsia sterculiae]|uniref:Phosphatidylinositol alpha 1,6-mannosyltransferase n=1 Tax=Williamsia sterculiae TaxID=1344003 RepID=A0A1N7D324_9NOCA|nr:glycosyltransferase family 1 protein [Williamsia sterculiae]SIR70095.1 phosphatidylinositol alpha 1,6-mannosyltransferase [Williamsia sterculiae]